MLKHDAMFFIAALFFIFVIWVATGGPTRPISFAGPFLNAPSPLSNGAAYFLPGAGFTIGTTHLPSANFTIGGENEVSLGGGSGSINPLIYGPASSYSTDVYFSGSATDAKETLADTEYLTLQVSGGATQDIPITGWKFVSSRTGNIATIGNAALLPLSGTINTERPVVLRPGDTMYFTTGRPPSGVSFRENKCTGYLDQYQRFIPSIALSCPSAATEYGNLYGDGADDQRCWDYINSLNQCESVTRLPIDSVEGALSSRCHSFVTEHLSYNACVANHASDPDFAGTEWHIFFNRSTELWAQPHDTIKLVDESGKTVDVFSY